jgi:SAM-dependent methyltransferase
VRAAVEGDREYARLGAAMTDLVVYAAAGKTIGSVLDVGCGPGGYTLQHVKALGVPLEKVHGVEYHPEHAKAAAEHFHVERVDLETQRLPFDDGSVDLVMCNQVLEHMKNVFWALSEMDRVLAVGGILAVGVPNLTALTNRLVLLAGRQPVTIGIEGPHVRGFAHRSFREFLLGHPGYRLRGQRGSSLYPWPAKLGAERLARRLPGLSAYTFYSLEKMSWVEPCPWLSHGTDGETSYVHAPYG